jgi:enterochelin esterase family protein
MPVHTARGPVVRGDTVHFALPDPRRELTRVRLLHELRRPRAYEFGRAPRGRRWTLEIPRPDADRFEYLLELTGRDGGAELGPDPANPLRAPGPFGDKSVVELPGYEPPAWLTEDAPPGDLELVEIPFRALRTTLEVPVWTATGGGATEELPLLVVHDGPEYQAYSHLLDFLDAAWADGRLPTMRAALVPPAGDRNQSYSGSAHYARALAHELLPALAEAAPTPGGRQWRVGMGASLGALAMLHCHRVYPQTFGGLFLQSGSFFRQRSDKQESGFLRFRRIARAVGQILAGKGWFDPVPVTMTCGTVEENLDNNRAVQRALRAQGYEVELVENRDAHNWTGWRDAFDPHLADLLRAVWA